MPSDTGEDYGFGTDGVPSDVKKLPDHFAERRNSNVRWSKQQDIFLTGKYPMLSWNLYEYNPATADISKPPKPEDFFKVIKPLGSGTFGKVKLVETIITGELLAMKLMSKQKCSKALRNKELLAHITVGVSPFIVRYHSCFQTENHCYILLQYHRGGSLAKFMEEHGVFDIPTTRFYAAEIVEGLLHMHDIGIIHRDIKLTNVLLGTDNHVRICDLGLCKMGMKGNRKTHTRCGALRYCAPEVLRKEPYGREVDWWSLGIVLYRMVVGKYPFDGASRDEIKEKIQNEEPDYTQIIDPAAEDITRKFLEKTQSERLGFADTAPSDIRGQQFFEGIDWEQLRARGAEVPSVQKRFMRRSSLLHQEEILSEIMDEVSGFRADRRDRKRFCAILLLVLLVVGAAVAVVFRSSLSSTFESAAKK